MAPAEVQVGRVPCLAWWGEMNGKPHGALIWCLEESHLGSRLTLLVGDAVSRGAALGWQ
jgi:hypothetical protein